MTKTTKEQAYAYALKQIARKGHDVYCEVFQGGASRKTCCDCSMGIAERALGKEAP